MKSLITAVFLAGIASQALAGEDSTHRLHGVGPAWYEIEDGLRKLAAEGSDEPAATNKGARVKPRVATTGVTNK
jgi:hypothetical protein